MSNVIKAPVHFARAERVQPFSLVDVQAQADEIVRRAHAAAAGITANTKCIAFTVSESDGTVRVWRAGKLVADFETSRR